MADPEAQNTTLITEVPDFSDPAVAARYRAPLRGPGVAFTTEDLPRYYVSPDRPDAEFGTDTDAQIRQFMHQLGGDILYSGREHDTSTIQHLYGVARSIGDPTLALAERSLDPDSGEVMALVDATRFFATPLEYDPGSANWREIKTVGSHSAETRKLTTNLDYIRVQAVDLARELQQGGVKIDVAAATAVLGLEVAAHESGHALLAGAGTFINDTLPTVIARHTATKSYLMQNPEQAITGNYDTDVAIHEERFAEGYAQTVVDRALSAMGYDDADRDKVLAAIRPGILIDIADGEHQLDHLDQVDSETSIDEALKKQGVTDEMLEQSHQGYLGNIGYALPLSTNELVAQLQHLSQGIKQKTLSPSEPMNDTWANETSAADRTEVLEKVAAIKAERQRVLAERTRRDEKVTKRKKIAAGLAGALRRRSKSQKTTTT